MHNGINHETDADYMQEAISCARNGQGCTRPNPPVGAVVVAPDGHIIGRGYHRKAGTPHAEVNAIADCGDADLSGATIYVTLEPCSTTGRTPPCTDLIIRKRLARVVIGCVDPNPKHAGRGVTILRDAGIDVTCPVCEKECRSLIEPFASAMLRKRPWVTLKLAMSLDGRIADYSGASKWITGPESRDFVQDLRRQADAIMVGAGTVCADNPELICRLPGCVSEPWRIVVDSSGRTPVEAKVFSDRYASRTIIATTPAGAARLASRRGSAAFPLIWEMAADAEGHVDLRALLDRLTAELGVMHLLCEGGGQLAGTLLKEGHADRLIAFHAPVVLGADALPSFAISNQPISNAQRFEFEYSKVFGSDVMASYRCDSSGELKMKSEK